MKLLAYSILSSCILSGFVQAETHPLEWQVSAQDVAWDSPSPDARGSMPIGNGDIGVNAWVEPSGDLVLLIGKSDSFDEFNRLLKLGRVRIKTTPALVQPGKSFEQIVRLEDGAIEIKTSTAKLRVWVDANHPVVETDLTATTPLEAEVILEDWRSESRELTQPEKFSCWGNWPDKMRVNADTLLAHGPAELAWCHHNVESQWARNLELTALGDEVAKGHDPVLNRTFGAVVKASGCQAVSDTQLKTSAPAKDLSVQVFPLTQIADSPAIWLKAAEAEAAQVKETAESRFTAHQAWWRAFWNRSWITITGSSSPALTFAGKLQIGHDPTGGSRFGGIIANATSVQRVMSPEEIAKLAQGPHEESASTEVGDIDINGAFSVAAWVKPTPGEGGRILDKCTVGAPDGLLFDTYPGESLRLSVGSCVISIPHCLGSGKWRHVAATVDGKTREQKLYLDGKLLKSEIPISDTTRVTRAYALQRYVTACAGRGSLPIKFNGSLFTVEGHDPDFRAWGGGYWWQNTREAYWPMLYAGDYDEMLPLFSMYRNALPLREAATRKYYGHEGAFFPETIYLWGNYMDAENYGIDRKGKPDGLTDNTYIRRYWQSGIELVAMMLDYFDGTQDTAFRDKTLLPIAKDIALFYAQHWPAGKDGKILFDPAQSLETWHTATNPLPEIAGLRFVLPRLLALPADSATKEQWRKLLANLPVVPTVTENGQTRIVPAVTFSNKRNMENPELYGVFPYRIYTAMTGGEELAEGLNGWRRRGHPEDRGWQQNCIQAALLGLSKEAKSMVAARAVATASGYRFPGFFGPNYDWTPEQCHGTNMMTALQRMVMQCEGDKIVLAPAWPADWNATFKLHAPRNTVIEGQIEQGKVIILKVTPESRRKDITIHPAFQ